MNLANLVNPGEHIRVLDIPQRKISNITYFVMKRIHLQLKVVKYGYSLFASQEIQQIVASETLPAKIDTLKCFMSAWELIKISIFPCFSPYPNLIETELFLCNHCICKTGFLIENKEGILLFILFCENASKEDIQSK